MSWGRVVRAALAVAGAGVLTVGVLGIPSTTAAWTDDVVVAPAASTGTWSTAAVPNPAGVVTAGPSTTVTGITWTVPANPAGLTCVDVTVTGSSTTPQAWSFSLKLDGPPFFGTPRSALYSGGLNQFGIGAGPTAASAVISGVGTGNPFNSIWSNRLLSSSQSLMLRVCTSNPQTAAPAGPSWYAVTQAASGTWTATRTCVAVTVTGNRSLSDWPFWFGWQATVDLSAAKAHLVAAGRTVNFVAFSPDPSGGYRFTTSPNATSPVADRYTLTSGNQTPVRGTGSTTITACVHGF